MNTHFIYEDCSTKNDRERTHAKTDYYLGIKHLSVYFAAWHNPHRCCFSHDEQLQPKFNLWRKCWTKYPQFCLYIYGSTTSVWN